MNRPLTLGLLVLLGSPMIPCTAVSAQGYLITPKSAATSEGPDSAYIFGWAADQKNRFMDASHAGKGRSLKGVSYRVDYRSQSSIGRTWSKVTILAAHGDFSSIRYNKANTHKLLSTPTQVFDAKWSFPTLSGTPSLKPATWGGPKGGLSFRFKKPWLYNGKDAIFLDYHFKGGVAADNRAWKGGTPKGFEYYLDSMPQASWRGGKGTTRYSSSGGKGSKGCFDSGFAGKVAVSFNAMLSGDKQITLSIYSQYTAAKNPVLYALGVSGSSSGANIGAQCNPFYLTGPMAILTQPAPNNITGYQSLTLKGPRQSWMKEFWVQGGFLDSKTKGLKLTDGLSLDATGAGGIIPAATSYTTGGAFNVWTAAAKGLPFMRYEY